MKSTAILLILLTAGYCAYAQSDSIKLDSNRHIIRFDSPIRKRPKPLFLIVYQEKQYSLDSTAIHYLDPNMIKSVDVLKQEDATQEFGAAAKNGVIKLRLQDEIDPKQVKILKKHLKIF